MEKRHPGGAGILSLVKKSHYESVAIRYFPDVDNQSASLLVQ